jgi:ABC-type Mn2+/Zn2+ transport system permease subunit
MWLSEPFDSALVRNALVAGVIAAALCAVVGTWVVLRGSTFLGEAMGHGILPGVALASLFGGNLLLGAMVAALAMAYGVSAIGSSTQLSADTSIGLLLVGMLATGVMVVSHSQSFAVDLTGLLFGDVLAADAGDIAVLLAALAVTLVVASVGRRAFVATTFDTRKAVTLGLRPKLAGAALTVLMAIAIVASFHVVGTLLVLALLVAPPAAAVVWADSIGGIMVGAAIIGSVAVGVGLVASWHAGTAGGATIAATAVLLFFLSLAARALRPRIRAAAVGVLVLAGVLTACSSASAPAPESEVDQAGMTGTAEEQAEPLTRLILVESDSGATAVFDVIGETETALGEFGAVHAVAGDGRFGYLLGAGTTVVDSGAWTFDHGDHNHYYATAPALVGDVDTAAQAVTADNSRTALRGVDGGLRLLDREVLAEGDIRPQEGVIDGVRAAAPFGDSTVLALESGDLQIRGGDGAPGPSLGRCEQATGAVPTRRAVVFGCRGGAIRVSGDDESPEMTALPFPAKGPSATIGPLVHSGRDGVLVALAGDEIWALDTAAEAWTALPANNVVAAGSAGDGAVLALARDGALRSYDLASGREIAELQLFKDVIPVDIPVPSLEIDADRAYVNDAVAGVVYEIDYRAPMRLARTLDSDVRPDLMVETGR